MDENLKKRIDELTEQSDMIIANPQTIEHLRKQGLPITSTFTTYEEYLDKLFKEKEAISKSLIGKLPRLNDKIANATVQSLYQEVQESFILGIPGAAITLSVILLELALKYRLYEERFRNDPKAPWEPIEQLDLKSTINRLRKLDVLSSEEKKELDDFNDQTRNPYAHYNVQKLVSDMVIPELSSLDTTTGEIKIHKNVSASEHQHLWFSAKRFLDKVTVESHVKYCVEWTNKLLTFTD